MKVTANAQRSGDWWAIEVPEVPGVFTQARRLDQVEEMVRDAVALMEEIPESEIEVNIVVAIGEELAASLDEARRARAEAEALSERAAAETRSVARTLQALGVSMRDIGIVLGVSHQRVAQLLDPVGPRPLAEHVSAAQRAAERQGKPARAAAAKAQRALDNAGVTKVAKRAATQKQAAARAARQLDAAARARQVAEAKSRRNK